MIDLHKRFERDAQAFAVVEHATMVIRQAPGTRIDVEAGIELALLGLSSQFRVAIAAAQRPVAAARARVVFQHLHLVARIAQLVGGDQSGNSGTQHQNRGALRCGAQADRALEIRFRRQSETVHGLVHHAAAGA